jgi:hypothetical protein
MTGLFSEFLEMKSQYGRASYLVLFGSVLLLTIIITLCVYYLVRYKRKYYFDAAGRKFIVSDGEHSDLVLKMMEIIQFDNKYLLEEEVISNFYFFYIFFLILKIRKFYRHFAYKKRG